MGASGGVDRPERAVALRGVPLVPGDRRLVRPADLERGLAGLGIGRALAAPGGVERDVHGQAAMGLRDPERLGEPTGHEVGPAVGPDIAADVLDIQGIRRAGDEEVDAGVGERERSRVGHGEDRGWMWPMLPPAEFAVRRRLGRSQERRGDRSAVVGMAFRHSDKRTMIAQSEVRASTSALARSKSKWSSDIRARNLRAIERIDGISARTTLVICFVRRRRRASS